MSRKIKNAVLRRNTTGCHAQRHVTRAYLIDITLDFMNHWIVTASSIRAAAVARMSVSDVRGFLPDIASLIQATRRGNHTAFIRYWLTPHSSPSA